MSNLKQWGMGTIMYTQDYDGSFPMSIYTPDMQRFITMYDACMPYVKNTGVMACPSDTSPMTTAQLSAAFGGLQPVNTWSASYNGNYALFEDGPNNVLTNSNHAVINDAELPYPAETIMWADGRLMATFNSPFDARHSEGVNVSLADGHAKFWPCKEAGTYQDFRGLSFKYWYTGSQSGPYTGRWEVWGVVKSDRTVGALR